MQVEHYVEKPATYISHHINCGIYLITPALFARLAAVFTEKAAHAGPFGDGCGDGYAPAEAAETIWFERDIFPGLAGTDDFAAYQSNRWWSQIKTAAFLASSHPFRGCVGLGRRFQGGHLCKPALPESVQQAPPGAPLQGRPGGAHRHRRRLRPPLRPRPLIRRGSPWPLCLTGWEGMGGDGGLRSGQT